MKPIKGSPIAGVIGIAAPVFLAVANDSIFILKRLEEGAKSIAQSKYVLLREGGSLYIQKSSMHLDVTTTSLGCC